MRNNLSLKVGKLKKKSGMKLKERKLKESKDELDPVFFISANVNEFAP